MNKDWRYFLFSEAFQSSAETKNKKTKDSLGIKKKQIINNYLIIHN